MLELLAPSGNVECAFAAINGGADAIYVGLDSFSARHGAENFDQVAFQEVVGRAHFCGVKVYVAMNTIVKDAELENFLTALLFAWNNGADAIILQDIFLGKVIHEKYPKIALHLSTQAGVCNVYGAKLAKEYGFSRIILARETPLAEIAEITKIIETEAFIQGALCTSFSGQCYFSSFVGGNSGNRGRCKQPCRKQYAYDRNGNEEKSYALSPSDLCVGEDIQKLIEAGVSSFKIEGRMRRAEYVAAAVRYYRGVLDVGAQDGRALSDLKRTYNRGNYTKGLAFGQDKRFLSTAIQGHIGEKVGVVKVIDGKFLVDSAFKPQRGDAFKILRDGKELTGAIFAGMEGKRFALHSKVRLKNGDGVFITTDTEVNGRVLSSSRRGELHIRLRFCEGEVPQAFCGEYLATVETVLRTAQNRPLTTEELRACFEKTDGLPVDLIFDEIEVKGDIFLPKSELNAFRRAFYAGLTRWVTVGCDRSYAYRSFERTVLNGNNEKTAVISDDFTGLSADVLVYKPKNLTLPVPDSFRLADGEKYLYFPAFTTTEDLLAIEKRLREGDFAGIYAENYGGVAFAKEHGVKLFAGTGFHLFNSLSVGALLQENCLSYYAISKECNGEEGKKLISEKAFAFSLGDIKIMDLCYCPFGKTCGVCDKREIYRLTDETGRVFPVRRYVAANGSCRFEAYNCASLIGMGIRGAGKLIDVCVTKDKRGVLRAKEDEGAQKEIYARYTSGHYRRGVL